jgi:ComF family protein
MSSSAVSNRAEVTKKEGLFHDVTAHTGQRRLKGPVYAFGAYVGRALTDALFPRKCFACGAYWPYAPQSFPRVDHNAAARVADHGLRGIFNQVALPFLCPDCLASFEPVRSPLCGRCGVMFKSPVGEDHLCSDCLRHPGAFRRARAAGVYSGALMGLVHRLKYRACLALIHPLGRLLQAAFRLHWQPGEIDMVLPVPLHARRWRQRGFNQAQMLVAAWAKAERLNARDGRRFPKARDIFVRSRPTVPQTGLNKPTRRRNIRGVFKVVDRAAVQGRCILLVDDVYTTGATVEEAARELKGNGACSVDVLTVARTMPHLYRMGRKVKRIGKW